MVSASPKSFDVRPWLLTDLQLQTTCLWSSSKVHAWTSLMTAQWHLGVSAHKFCLEERKGSKVTNNEKFMCKIDGALHFHWVYVTFIRGNTGLPLPQQKSLRWKGFYRNELINTVLSLLCWRLLTETIGRFRSCGIPPKQSFQPQLEFCCRNLKTTTIQISWPNALSCSLQIRDRQHVGWMSSDDSLWPVRSKGEMEVKLQTTTLGNPRVSSIDKALFKGLAVQYLQSTVHLSPVPNFNVWVFFMEHASPLHRFAVAVIKIKRHYF